MAPAPRCAAHRIHELPGIDGDRFVRELWTAVGGSNPWVEYDIVNPDNGQVQPKASYVIALNDRQALGCGVYRTRSDPRAPVRSAQGSASHSRTPAGAVATA